VELEQALGSKMLSSLSSVEVELDQALGLKMSSSLSSVEVELELALGSTELSSTRKEKTLSTGIQIC